jgi:hypothetical protein
MVAVVLFAVPQVPVTRTQYVYVPRVSLPVFKVLDVAPETGVDVLPLVPRYHWYVSVPVPVAVTESRYEVFRGMVALCGCCVIEVAGFTVTVVAALVALQPLPLVTVTEYEPLVVAEIAGVVAPLDQR